MFIGINFRGSGLFAAFLLLVLSVAVPLNAIPSRIAISGSLRPPEVGEEEEPLPIPHGLFPGEIRFFDNPMGQAAPLATLNLTFDVQFGLFKMVVDLPEVLLSQSNLWYQIGIDIDLDGLTAEDFFPDLFEIVSVPFALSGQIQEVFETGHGQNRAATGSVSGDVLPNTIVVAPFSTPPGGVRFNRFVSRSTLPNPYSFGIYDSEGKIVFDTNRSQPAQLGGMYVWEADVHLKPSRVYFTAWTTGGDRFASIRPTAILTIPLAGRVLRTGTDGRLPAVLDISEVQPMGIEPAMSFGLYRTKAGSGLDKLEKALGLKFLPDPAEDLAEEEAAVEPPDEGGEP